MKITMKKSLKTITRHLLATACLGLAAHNVSAQAVFTPSDRLLRVGTLTIGSEVWTDLILHLDNDNRLSIVSAKPPATNTNTSTNTNSSTTTTTNTTTTSTGSTTTSSSTQWRGVNLAGAEFGEGSLPGTYGTHYIYPEVSSVTYFRNKGMNTIRLPFRWERLQPTLMQAFNATELARLTTFVNGATAQGMTVIIDPHNYARWQGKIIGSSEVPNSAFADFWSRLATQFKGNSKVVFGLMNEPNNMPTEQWLSAANAAIAAIRTAGATNTIAVPGNAWTGAHSWSQNWYGTPNATVMKGISDPARNVVIEVHQYLDGDSSGTSSNCVSTTIGKERLQDFTSWLRTNGYRAFLGEMAAGDNATCNQAMADMLTYLKSNADVWQGWTWWAAGPWWGGYMFSIEPTNGTTDKPQMSVIAPFLK